MRILHVVTLVSVNGAYGGPVAVAVGQTQALAELGHDVTLLAGWDGRATLSIPNVDVQLFRARQAVPRTSFSGMCSSGILREVRRRAADADVVTFEPQPAFRMARAGNAVFNELRRSGCLVARCPDQPAPSN